MQNYIKTIVNAIKLWVSDKIYGSVADWNENDSNADSYVKNRTHYEDIEKVSIEGMEYLLIEGELHNVTEYDYDAIPLALGQKWAVYRDASNLFGEYEVQRAEDGTLYIGDINTNSIPFYITEKKMIISSHFSRVFELTGMHIVGISGYVISTKLKQLDEKYILTADEADTVTFLADIGVIEPTVDENGAVYVDEDGNIYSL